MKKSKGKQIFQQFLIAVIVFSLILPGSLWAKREKAGAKIIVTKKDGRALIGELLKVEGDSLLLMAESLEKLTVNISEIVRIRIIRKSKAIQGVLIGGITGFGIGYFSYRRDEDEAYINIIVGILGSLAGLLSGGLLGSELGTDRIFKIESGNKHKLEHTLKELNQLARFKTKDSSPVKKIKINIFSNLGIAQWELDGMFFDVGLEIQLNRHIYGQFLYDYYQNPVSWGDKKDNSASGYNLYVVYKQARTNRLSLFIKGGIHYSNYRFAGPNSGIIFKDSYLGFGTGAGIEASLSKKLALLLGVTVKTGTGWEHDSWVKCYFGLNFRLNK